MSSPQPTAEPTVYRLAPLLVARFVGAYLLLLAVVMVLATVLVATLSAPLDVLVVLLALGLLVMFAGATWLRGRAYVVRLDEQGYVVRMIRGAGVKQGAWADVAEAVASHPHDIACMVLRLRDGRTTTIPVEALASDRDEFARDVRDRLDRATKGPQ